MAVLSDAELRAALGRQALGRRLSVAETEFAAALEEIFASGEHHLSNVVALLEARGVKRPSGSMAGWSLDVLGEELEQINDSLDEAYRANGAALLQGVLP